MSDHTPRVSRRQLLEIAGLAPLAALAASGASTAELACKAEDIADVPTDAMTELLKKANKYKKDKNETLDEDKFRLVVAVLWRYFTEGALPVKVKAGMETQILLAAYKKTGKLKNKASGELIADQLHLWDPCGHQPATNTCAFRTGVHAADRATQKHPNDAPVIDHEQMFNDAWDDTEKEVGPKIKRLRQLQKRLGKSIDEQTLGAGC